MRASVSLVARSKSAHTRPCRRKPRPIERLEDRLLMTADPQGSNADDAFLSCACPVCTGMLPLLSESQTEIVGSGGPAGAPLSSLPLLSSNPSATAKLFLDFDGHYEAQWAFKSNVSTPAFDQDGNSNDFSAGELAAIQEIWARVAEDYAPFNIDVTTIDPGHQTDRVVAVVAIGGNYSDWYGSAAGGVAFVGGFSNFSSNVGYVFSTALGNSAKNVAEAASHEAGHLFGLSHQARWDGTNLTQSYHSGDGNWAPIMGNSYSATRSTWHNGTTSASNSSFQDDLTIIASANNGFGYKTDDFGSTTGTSSNLAVSGSNVSFSGLIGRNDDQDMWSFTTSGGTVSFNLTGAAIGANLDGVLQLANSSGTIITTSAPTGSLNASISLSVGAGTYYLIARGEGDYGDVGQYTITGTLPGSSTAPSASLSVGGSSLADGGTLAFGTTTVGTAVTRTITVTNNGNAVLNLTSLNAGAMPAGFTLVQNLGANSLNPGASTTFVVRLTAAAAGNFSGTISLGTNDTNHNPYSFQVSGTVNAVQTPSIDLSVGGNALSSGGTVNFGTTTTGTFVTRTITVTNQGTANLTLTSLSGVSLPAGFTLVQDLGATSLSPGASTTFVVRLTAASTGSFSGQFSLLSNDATKSPFVIQLAGTVNAVQLPSLNLSVGGNVLNSGGTVNFGTTTAGVFVTRTITVTNQGTANLTLTSLTGVSLPAGFTLVQDLGATSLSPGGSTTFVVRLTAATAGSFSGQFSLLSNDATKSPFNIQLSGTVNAALTPTISLSVGGVALTPGSMLDFGSAVVGTSVTRTVTIKNTGTGTLTLSPLSGSSLPSGFTLVQNIQNTSLAPGASTTFIISLGATAAGSYSGQVSLASNDPTQGNLSFGVCATVQAAPTYHTAIIDDGGAGNRLTGTWKTVNGKGYASDMRTASKGNGSINSTWTFNNLPSGLYQVFVTWKQANNYATNSPFTITSGGNLVSTVRTSQRVAPSGAAVNGVNWKFLANVTVSAGSIVVKLTNNANGLVVADAVRIQQMPATFTPRAAASVEYALSGGTHARESDLTPKSALTARGHVEHDALPLPTATSPTHALSAAHETVESPAFSALLDLLSGSRQSTPVESAVDQVLSGGLSLWSFRASRS